MYWLYVHYGTEWQRLVVHSPPVKEVYQKGRTRGYGERSPITYQISDAR